MEEIGEFEPDQKVAERIAIDHCNTGEVEATSRSVNFSEDGRHCHEVDRSLPSRVPTPDLVTKQKVLSLEVSNLSDHLIHFQVTLHSMT